MGKAGVAIKLYGQLTYQERKARRAENFKKYVFGWKLRDCSACAGSGRYDHDGSPKCGGCDGTGKERYRDVESKAN